MTFFEGSHVIHCLGLNHNTASVALRERLAFSPYQLQAALARLGCGDDPRWDKIHELVILSTCNRVELYAIGDQPIFEILEGFLSETQNYPRSEFSPALYRLLNAEAIDHLFKVASGLDSLVVGEPQILGQVTEAYQIAQSQRTTGKILSRMFQSAIRAGKRARHETTISQNPASIASVAVNLISRTVSNLISAQVLVLGAGEMAELAVESLRKRGVKHILVINRTLESALQLADKWGGQAAALEMLPDHLHDMDIVITSTGAPHIVIQSLMVEQAMKHRPNRPMVFMDIAVPRDVDAEVGNIPSVRLYDMDALSDSLEISLIQRQAQVPMVKSILAEEESAFKEYLATLDVVPLICELRQQADEIRRVEIEKAIRRMPNLTPGMQRQIDALTEAIVKKILHSPTIRLREEAKGGNVEDYADLTRNLFGLG
ncbi:MAG: glutamyl-tRNA reductase [Anaerolineales bacterium]|nr:glutamyl-tRNA reductase [Anaerolineales bacterium]